MEKIANKLKKRFRLNNVEIVQNQWNQTKIHYN